MVIALQINNWNESKKLNDQLNQYKANLISELEKDIEEIDSLNSFRIECKKSILEYVEYYNLERLDIDTLIAKKNEMNPSVSQFNKSSYTLQELSNTGNISLFTNEEKKAIVILKNLQDKYEYLEKEAIDICINSYTLFSQNSDALYEEKFTSKEHKDSRDWRFNIDTKQYRLFNNYLSDLLSLYQVQDTRIYPELRTSTFDLLTLLKQK